MNQPTPLPLVTESSCGSGSGAVPVFSCNIILRHDPVTGRYLARSANLPGITAEESSERQALMLITRRFKALIQDLLTRQQPIPWLDPPERAGVGEVERFIPVHL